VLLAPLTGESRATGRLLPREGCEVVSLDHWIGPLKGSHLGGPSISRLSDAVNDFVTALGPTDLENSDVLRRWTIAEPVTRSQRKMSAGKQGSTA
jgi:hypothetical protein